MTSGEAAGPGAEADADAATSTSTGTLTDADASAPAEVGPGRRGATRIADRAVARIVEQAAREALRTGPDAAKNPRGRRTRPRANVAVHERYARVRVVVELGYPSDIAAQCAAVRRQIVVRVNELAGLDARHVAVGVNRLHSEGLRGDTSGRVR